MIASEQVVLAGASAAAAGGLLLGEEDEDSSVLGPRATSTRITARNEQKMKEPKLLASESRREQKTSAKSGAKQHQGAAPKAGGAPSQIPPPEQNMKFALLTTSSQLLDFKTTQHRKTGQKSPNLALLASSARLRETAKAALERVQRQTDPGGEFAQKAYLGCGVEGEWKLGYDMVDAHLANLHEADAALRLHYRRDNLPTEALRQALLLKIKQNREYASSVLDEASRMRKFVQARRKTAQKLMEWSDSAFQLAKGAASELLRTGLLQPLERTVATIERIAVAEVSKGFTGLAKGEWWGWGKTAVKWSSVGKGGHAGGEKFKKTSPKKSGNKTGGGSRAGAAAGDGGAGVVGGETSPGGLQLQGSLVLVSSVLVDLGRNMLACSANLAMSLGRDSSVLAATEVDVRVDAQRPKVEEGAAVDDPLGSSSDKKEKSSIGVNKKSTLKKKSSQEQRVPGVDPDDEIDIYTLSNQIDDAVRENVLRRNKDTPPYLLGPFLAPTSTIDPTPLGLETNHITTDLNILKASQEQQEHLQELSNKYFAKTFHSLLDPFDGHLPVHDSSAGGDYLLSRQMSKMRQRWREQAAGPGGASVGDHDHHMENVESYAKAVGPVLSKLVAEISSDRVSRLQKIVWLIVERVVPAVVVLADRGRRGWEACRAAQERGEQVEGCTLRAGAEKRGSCEERDPAAEAGAACSSSQVVAGAVQQVQGKLGKKAKKSSHTGGFLSTVAEKSSSFGGKKETTSPVPPECLAIVEVPREDDFRSRSAKVKWNPGLQRLLDGLKKLLLVAKKLWNDVRPVLGAISGVLKPRLRVWRAQAEQFGGNGDHAPRPAKGTVPSGGRTRTSASGNNNIAKPFRPEGAAQLTPALVERARQREFSLLRDRIFFNDFAEDNLLVLTEQTKDYDFGRSTISAFGHTMEDPIAWTALSRIPVGGPSAVASTLGEHFRMFFRHFVREVDAAVSDLLVLGGSEVYEKLVEDVRYCLGIVWFHQRRETGGLGVWLCRGGRRGEGWGRRGELVWWRGGGVVERGGGERGRRNEERVERSEERGERT